MENQERDLQQDPQQNRQQDQQQNDQQGSSLAATEDPIKHVGSESNAAPSRGLADLTSRPSEGVIGNTHSSGVNTKRSVTGSDFDGQVTPS